MRQMFSQRSENIGRTVANESTLRSAGSLMSRVRALPPALWPDGGPESLRSPCCGLAISETKLFQSSTEDVFFRCVCVRVWIWGKKRKGCKEE
ncbi:hypothetical protein PoB_002486600 [Plakobranchus ocellatus]|uniref:Uncharacterized protein n=1 Tax=Plakobranchus ocellatus TaxID=259542 RepID=A0AAV3ZGR3_9GAST|nr:hypothetical protein PoB_002486600 [Plakobranchus ocellatus]